jgi:hypothetical protein
MYLTITNVTRDWDYTDNSGNVVLSLTDGVDFEGFVSAKDFHAIMFNLGRDESRGYLSFDISDYVALPRDPDVDDDVLKGIPVGYRWYNTVTKRDLYCHDNSSGAAVWVERSTRRSGSDSPNGVLTGYYGDEYHDSANDKWYKCTSDPSGTSWAPIGISVTIDTIKGTGNPNGTVTGYLGDEYFDTEKKRWYKCISDPSGTEWQRMISVF